MGNRNLLDMIPQKNDKIPFTFSQAQMVVLTLEHKSIFDRIARFLSFTPEKSFITLDSYGSFLWNAMDGRKNIYELGCLLEREFGEKVHPLHERMIPFIREMKTNNLIHF